MREISLDITQTVIFKFKHESPDELKFEVDENGIRSASMGSYGVPEQQDLEIARVNGGKILYATTSIEKKLERFTLNYFIGGFDNSGENSEYNRRRQLFDDEVLKSSSFSFIFKKRLVDKILLHEKPKILKGNEISKLQGDLKKIMDWRNAFAHGDIRYDTIKGVLLKFYSNGHQTSILNDEYWDEIEMTFKRVNEQLEKVSDKVVS